MFRNGFSLTMNSDSLVSEEEYTQNTSSHAQFSQSCQSSWRDAFHTCTRVAQGQTGLNASLLRAFLKNTLPSSHHVSPGCSKCFTFILFDTSTDLDTDFSDADWNQIATERNSAVGWPVIWPTPFQPQDVDSDINHKERYLGHQEHEPFCDHSACRLRQFGMEFRTL